MFGLKIVKKRDYLDLEEQLELAQRETSDKAVEVANLQGEIQFLNNRVAELEAEVLKLNADKQSNDVVLITDVAESSLVEEKPAKKTKKVVKVTEEKKPRKKVVHKSDETE